MPSPYTSLALGTYTQPQTCTAEPVSPTAENVLFALVMSDTDILAPGTTITLDAYAVLTPEKGGATVLLAESAWQTGPNNVATGSPVAGQLGTGTSPDYASMYCVATSTDGNGNNIPANYAMTTTYTDAGENPV
jgi:hypothetical protein